MAFTPIEWMALILALVAAIKIVIILIKPAAWMSVIKVIYGKPILTMIISLILAVITLNYLLAEITIVQIFAVMLFVCFLMAISVAAYFKELQSVAQKMLKDRRVLKKSWLGILVWIVLIIWVLKILLNL